MPQIALSLVTALILSIVFVTAPVPTWAGLPSRNTEAVGVVTPLAIQSVDTPNPGETMLPYERWVLSVSVSMLAGAVVAIVTSAPVAAGAAAIYATGAAIIAGARSVGGYLGALWIDY